MQHGVRGEGTALDGSRPGAPQRLVTLHSAVKLFNAARPQQFCLGYRVLNSNVSALPMMWQHAVRGVAYQHNATAMPSLQWPYCEQTPAKAVRDSAYHFDDGWMPTPESRDGLVMCDWRDPILMRPGYWPFNDGEKIDVKSRPADRIVQKMGIRPHPELQRMRVR
jgi:hypothetical protein